MSNSEKRGSLEAVLTLLKMSRSVAMYLIEEKNGELFLQVTQGDQYDGDNLAKDIAEMSEGAIDRGRITVRTMSQRR
jgi:hypothetical protein